MRLKFLFYKNQSPSKKSGSQEFNYFSVVHAVSATNPDAFGFLFQNRSGKVYNIFFNNIA